MDTINIEAIRKRLDEIERERAGLTSILEGWEVVKTLKSTQQLPLTIPVPTANGTSGRISFPNGLRQVLQRAGGNPMQAADIWNEMQALGVVSNAKRPQNYISLNAKQNPNIEALGHNTFRWIGD